MQRLLRAHDQLWRYILSCGALAVLLLGTSCTMSQNVRDLQPVPDQPPLENLNQQS